MAKVRVKLTKKQKLAKQLQPPARSKYAAKQAAKYGEQEEGKQGE